MRVAELYFDESGSHQGSRYLTVAGFWFESAQAVRFARDWEKILDRFGLQYAHMTDCALGFGQYKNMSLEDRIKSGSLLIENIKRRTRFGFSVTIEPSRYLEVMADVPGAPSPYTQCLMTLFHQISRFVRANNFDGQIRCLFEAGHESAAEANRYFDAISLHGADWTDAVRYGGHEFVDKRDALPLQAADMLAWQVRHFFERKAKGHDKPRKDLVALTRPLDMSAEFVGSSLEALRDFLLELEPIVRSGDNLSALAKGAEIFDRYGLSYSPPPKRKI
ncbi:DUF3800 domain-containing protein [Pontixanthobacter aestiaquae]|uniref:DUF3800 domain-containing protein n=1 Tax=Pontixanthobacter aestiaquae TaxID=1509367 RepID=A0A844Z817_9SPHN|nr:DUF3800 domain-containing protein [Pontixanthobacter aestiaquae]MDN3645934.1 DUF3800 domain-containing protein [Pontixanthobacter aestiaquae]MXO83073.1 DUF3800 domain-containing protein [Pontixanthobacter aestiaquae]